MEGFGSVGRILPCHGIHNKQGFSRLDRGVQTLDLIHQRLVDMQTPRRIHNQYIGELLPCRRHGSLDNLNRILFSLGGEKVHAHLMGQGLELTNRRRPIHIRGHHHDLFLLPLL